jgi:hypothetical protein
VIRLIAHLLRPIRRIWEDIGAYVLLVALLIMFYLVVKMHI